MIDCEQEIASTIHDKFSNFLLDNKENVVALKFNIIFKNNFVKNKRRRLLPPPVHFSQQIIVPRSCLLIDYKVFNKHDVMNLEDFSKPPFAGDYITSNAKHFGGNGTIFVLMGEELRWIEVNFADVLSWQDISSN